MSYQKIICAIAMCLITPFFPAFSRAEGCYPLQISLAPPAQLVPKEREVCGVRLDLLWGDNKAVWGVDAGLANGAESIRGIEAGALFNRLKSAPESPATGSWGLQMAGLVNSNANAGFAGIQAAGLVNDHDDASFTGIQLAGVANDNDKALFKGVQVALFSNQNFESDVAGLQVALFNQAKTFKGVQIGVGNGVSTAEGAVGTIVVPAAVVIGAGGGSLPHGGWGSASSPKQPLLPAHERDMVKGVQLGLFTNIAKDMQGLQASLFFNEARKSMSGIQIGLFNNLGGFSGPAPVVHGLQLGASANFASEMTGFQLGTLNRAKNVTGMQIGIINVCSDLKGLQIGAINIVTSRVFSFTPIINIGF